MFAVLERMDLHWALTWLQRHSFRHEGDTSPYYALEHCLPVFSILIGLQCLYVY
ncbi:hypothetical protein TRIATDRAFT_256042 [Trichoderma atroviride IMI 206040]|uniref:Uncharacterized protein n=1 Tax=Hypocrea atroviridis (strain ATCC 20476 / IMI 206040) TaxID=452589 RepID=G9NNS4_HYPAI|nr:uncharacterized protein TRIATDRAFT_256042 [Trichoderma atroviride IMI 206040]EHK47715.1 hypothetical protein TRIATDRAFT_256042 [Trichoderma atroviride IMI 206040]